MEKCRHSHTKRKECVFFFVVRASLLMVGMRNRLDSAAGFLLETRAAARSDTIRQPLHGTELFVPESKNLRRAIGTYLVFGHFFYQFFFF